ncbi:MAG: CocE/NonD family hydrolase, partial [Actinomycetota bacterium]|nr:CocE/NonD family hydrolase [Actinomycetota bacterium]
KQVFMTTSPPAARRGFALLVAVLATALALPALPAAAAESYEVHYVPSVDGSVIRVEIRRDPKFDAAKQPVILTYSPYNTLGEPRPAEDPVGDRYVPNGYARAVADVLGTRGSTGCWDYGGPKEQQSGIDVVKFLARQPWSNGNVGMTGVSYEGTTANMVAAAGDRVPELKGVVPIAAISRWYGYAYGDGVRYFLNSQRATDEGFDTPLAFDFGFGDTVAADPTGQHFADTVKARAAECRAVEHTQKGYNRSPDYDAFWQARDYLAPAAAGQWRAATLVVHGWQDYNVKQEEGTDLYEQLAVDDPATEAQEGVPFKRLWMTQATHANGSGPGYQELLDAFWAHTLKGEPNAGFTTEPTGANSLGRSLAGADKTFTADATWPPPAANDLTLYMHRSFDQLPAPAPNLPPFTATGEHGTLETTPKTAGTGWTMVSAAGVSEELTLRDPLNRKVASRPTDGGRIEGHGYYSLYHESAPLARDARLAGSAVLDAWVNSIVAGMHYTPILAEVKPDGTATIVERGFLNLDYRNGLAKAEPKTGWQHATVEFLPQDYTFTKGNRIALILQSTNNVWAVPGNPGFISTADGPIASAKVPEGAKLILPLVGVDGAGALFAQ